MAAIHADVVALLALGRAAGSLPFEAMEPSEARRAYHARRLLLQLPPDPVAELRNIDINGPGGLLRLRLYRGMGTELHDTLPCLLYLHGGGWVLGDLDSHDGICCALANKARCCVVAVHYRLAPEHPFPAAVEDGAAALRWVAREAASLRIDPLTIAVGGDSAGGNLAAVLALMGRDGTVPASVLQVLLYPAVDMTMAGESQAGSTEGMTITPATMRYFIEHYVPNSADRRDWRASPLKAETLRGVPPAFVLTCGHDPLRDEGLLYAARLEREGVPVAALHLSDQTHGMLTMSKVIGAVPGTLAYVAATLRERWRTTVSLAH
jgi:acetyl esterase